MSGVFLRTAVQLKRCKKEVFPHSPNVCRFPQGCRPKGAGSPPACPRVTSATLGHAGREKEDVRRDGDSTAVSGVGGSFGCQARGVGRHW